MRSANSENDRRAANLALRIYRRLAEAFPHEFKLAYGADVVQTGEDSVEEIARRHGALGLLRLVADIAIRVPIEYAGEMRRDLRYALRSLLKSPGFALVGILSMALSIGLTTNVYTSKWQMLFRKLPAVNADRLFVAEKPVSYPYIEQFREQKNLFSGVAALETGAPFNVTFQGNFNGKPQRVMGQLVSPDYFSVLGIQPQLGRVLDPALDQPGSEPSVLISDRFWRNRLNSSPDAVGQTIRVNGQIATIVGIAPKDFNGAVSDVDNLPELFVPVTVPAALAPELADGVLHQRNAKDFLAILCLAPGVAPETAAAALDTLTRHLDEQDPSIPLGAANAARTVLIPAGNELPIPKNLHRVIVGFFLVLMALIMTIACMNLANMLLARGANRRKELAIRLSIGASRARLIRQMITEGVVLALLGGAAALPFAYWLSAVYTRSRTIAPGSATTASVLDWRAAVFVLALSILCGVGFSLAPALRATKADLAPALKEGSALQLAGYRRIGLRNILMVAQVAASLMLLLITGFLVVGLKHESQIQTKFDARTMYLLSIDPVREGYSFEKAQSFFERLPDQLKAAPEIQSVALAAQPPFAIEDEDAAVPLTAEVAHGPTQRASRVQISAIEESVGAGYFAALSEPVLSGREFDRRDQHTPADAAQALPVILNENAARGFFGGESAIGRRIRDEKHAYEVVGVVRNLNNGIGISQSVMYLPLTPRDFVRPPAGGITIMVRGNSGADVLAAVRRQIALLDPNLNVFNEQTLAAYLDVSRAAERFSIDTYASIGVFGLVLAAIGLAGITAYTVAQRSKEIGIRMALGARKGQVLLQVLREGTALVIVGSIFGFAGAYALAKSLAALIDVFAQAFKVGTGDARLLLGAPLLLAAVTLVACYLPARRATQIDPLKALREG
jgi:macrolide transport system ATP-binding/permease protein